MMAFWRIFKAFATLIQGWLADFRHMADMLATPTLQAVQRSHQAGLYLY